jgi:hypothetical protein
MAMEMQLNLVKEWKPDLETAVSGFREEKVSTLMTLSCRETLSRAKQLSLPTSLFALRQSGILFSQTG